jgi:hypothetical protein
MQIEVVFDSNLKQWVHEFKFKTHTYIIAQTLTQLAIEGKKMVQQETRKNFYLHNEFIPRHILHARAEISDVRTKGQAESRIYTHDKIAFMGIHEEGDSRTPQARTAAYPPQGAGKDTNTAFTIPSSSRGFQGSDMRSGSGKILKKFAPTHMLRDRNNTTAGKRTGRRKHYRTPFMLKQDGKAIIAKRRPNSREIDVLFMFHSKPTYYRKRWDFVDTVRDFVLRNYQQYYVRNFNALVRR